MSDNKSGGSGTFGFVKPNTDETKQNPNAGIENTNKDDKVNTEQVAKVTVQQEMDEDANAPYVDRRSITIALVKNYSKYREANRTSLPRRVDYIGSSISSSRILSSNEQEVNAYFPRIIGLSPNNENFISAVKKYLNNIQIVVDELGRTFDISFNYKYKKDYDKVVAIEEAIDKKYKSTNRQNLNDLREALKEKITAINDLESTKYALGSPVNIEDYLMYRHCMLYNDIAKEIAKNQGIEKMSAQAVGGAVGWNPICIIIPCHRVVGINGSLTGYGGGIKNKIELLKLEGNDMRKYFVPKKGTAL